MTYVQTVPTTGLFGEDYLGYSISGDVLTLSATPYTPAAIVFGAYGSTRPIDADSVVTIGPIYGPGTHIGELLQTYAQADFDLLFTEA